METTELHEVFANSGYGRHLENQTRFNEFKPGWVTTELWCDLLGDDVNNLRHMPYTLNLAEQFTDLQEMDGTALQVTAITHDWGEAITGDIALPNKTKADEQTELFAYRQIAGELLGERAKKLTNLVLPILFDKSSPEADMFRSIEYVGYCATALKAGRVALGLAHDLIDLEVPRQQRNELTGDLYALHRAVEIYNFPTMKDYRKKYPAIKTMMERVL